MWRGMFEGLVRQLLLGYLGRYVKDIQKEQLKITLWNEEILLENVELILEAFDYLQLPFALKQGRVGRLSIKIPWKKPGWNPIIIILEDVFICASQRDDQDWSMDAVEKREFAGKKAKLAAAELAKLSRCVCDNQAGQSFMSYITAKILDSIQVSIRNVHVVYRDLQSDSAQIMFGLRFSSLTIMKQNPIGSSSVRVRGGQVNKIVEILGLELYCSTIQGAQYLTSIDDAGDSKSWSDVRFEGDKYDHILAPFDVSVSLLLNRSGKLDNDAPQYSISAELTGLVLSLDEVQLQQILILWDYLSSCQLREKYGRYRPWSIPISGKLKGWQTAWWHYAQESVLSDVRKKLKKTSWRYLGQRLIYRRKYVNLYKTKLEFLRQEQPIDECTLLELEQMEKESDIDDILIYRSAAEHELQEFLLNSSNSITGMGSANIPIEKSQNDEHSSGRPRGLLNWLSLGMLGAGGTDDSSQFSGVVSDEVIKDIYEATKFRPVPLLNGDAATNDKIYLSAIKFSIHQISATLRSMKLGRNVAELIFNGVIIECKLWEESGTITATVNSGEMVCPCSKKAILLMKRPILETNILENVQPSFSVQVDVSPINREVELSVKVMLQPLEVTFDSEFFLNFMDFYNVLQSFKFQHERVLTSLNGIKNVNARLLSKAEYILSRRKKVIWDVRFINIIVNIPWRIVNSEPCNMVLELGALLFISTSDLSSLSSDIDDQSSVLRNFLNRTSTSDFSMGFQLQDLYDHFEVKLNDFEMKIVMPHHSQIISVFEKFSSSIAFASCIILDESISKQLEVYIIVPSLHAQLSPSIFGAVLGILDSPSLKSNGPRTTNVFGFSITANLAAVSFHVNLENDGEKSSALILTLQELDIRYALQEFEECRICMKALKIYSSRSKRDSHILFSTGNLFAANSALQHDTSVGLSDQRDNYSDETTSADGCFFLHYEVRRSVGIVYHKCAVCLNDADLHCYPYIVGLLVGFCDRVSAYGISENSSSPIAKAKNPKLLSDFEFQRFGFSNFFETWSCEHAGIPLDHFPFVTIYNDGSLASLESSLIYGIPGWRKIFNLRDKKIKSPKFRRKKGSKSFHASPLASISVTEASPVSRRIADADVFIFDLNLSGIRVHFHDSSCIVGTVTLPISKSSLSIHKDSMDILSSTEGLTFSSSWWTQNFHDFLWGPSLPNLSPILNVRVKKASAASLSSQTDICIGIQHVCCILPPEFLSVVIGYFSLPEWTSNTNEQPVTKNHNYMDIENDGAITYKFEILDSTLISPIEGNDCQFLKLEIQQLYCSFIHKNASNNLLKDIPPECLVPENKVAEKNHSLNIFGRDLSLSLLFSKDDGRESLMFDQNIGCGTVNLIGQLSADLWITIPCQSESFSTISPAVTCIMARVNDCQLIAEDRYIGGFEALLDVINQFSSVDEDSKGFTSDVLQFIQLKRSLKENCEVLPVVSGIKFTELRCCVNSLLINFYRSREDSISSELVSKAEMQFICSASLRNEIPLNLDFSFSSLALYSMLNSVMLAQCTSTCLNSSVLDISLTKSDRGENELCVSLPSLDIWSHFFDWNEVIDLFNSYFAKLAKTSIREASSKNSTLDTVYPIENVTVTVSENALQSPSKSSYFSMQCMEDIFVLLGRLENIGITFHIPVCASEEAVGEFGVAEVHEQWSQNVSSNIVEIKQCKFVTVTLHSRGSELVIRGSNVKLKSNFEKTIGAVEICEDKSVHSWPFFQIFQLNVDAEICNNNQKELLLVRAEVRCDRLDVWLSHQVFYFWHDIGLKIPEAGLSQYRFNGLDLEVELRKVSLLLTDGRWSCNGPLLEILMRNLLLHANVTENNTEGLVTSDLQVNYYNIHKVLWEPFVEPWKFQLSIIRRHEMSALLDSSMMTDIHLESTAQLNLNCTESLIESIFRATEMIKDAWGLMGPNDIPESERFLNNQISENISAGSYAPYILQNLTSLPLVFNVYQGPVGADEFDVSAMKNGKSLQPDSSVPIYVSETPEEQLFRYRPTHSSDRLSDKQSSGVAHHFITIQFDGTSLPSHPMSMDLVGLAYFEVDFSKASNKIDVGESGDASIYSRNIEESSRTDASGGFVVPVVFDVSVQRYRKFVRLYSTVILLNATSMPLELRFDIPFGVSPKILDPIYPGQEFPLPLHLAEAGRMRWRPLGNTYLWSEAHNLSNILSRESRIGFLRSFVCYPSHPSSDPFRCCMSVEDINLPSSERPKKVSSLHIKSTVKQSAENCGQILQKLDKSKKRCIHQVTLSTPLAVKNYLPKAVSLTIESGGVSRTTFLAEVETNFFHIDSSHDLGLVFCMRGFKPSVLKFPRTETFSSMAKFSGTKFSLSETMTFDPDFCNGPMYVSVEKVMDAFSGARELCIFVPFLLYNTTGFSLVISEPADEMKGNFCTIPSCYDLVEQELLLDRKDGLSLLSSNQDMHSTAQHIDSLRSSFSKNRIVSTRKNVDPHSGRFLSKPLFSSGSSTVFHEQSNKHDIDDQKSLLNNLDRSNLSIQLNLKESDLVENECGKVKACMYSPKPSSSASEIMVRVTRCLHESVMDNMPNFSWSSSFSLVPPTGSTIVLVPQQSTNGASIISVTSSAVAGPFAGRTRAITFQPRYVISNACSKDLCYKQKGTDFVFHLGIGQHSHLHWPDTTRELLVSIHFNEPGWQWSGSFLPDHLGDTQLKMRNYVSGALNMIRVEVQNADVSIKDEKIIGNLNENSGTNLILLSDDDTGFMPYRIDNFSKERLRIYQQRCETFETIVHSYTSCSYAWDEPCYPHRLTVEVPGERVVGSYTLDDVKECMPIYLPSSSEKPERTLFVSVHAEGARKVLSLIDSTYHILKDTKDSRVPWFGEKRKHDERQDSFVDYKEKISVIIPYIGISLIDSYPQELLFACAKNTAIDLLQSLDQQKLSFQISSLQIDNELHSTPYPVILSFDNEYRSNPAGQMRTKDDTTKTMQIASNSSCEPVFCLAAAKWRNKDISLVSFEYISLRVADFHLELEQEVILSLFDLFRTVSSRFQSRVNPFAGPTNFLMLSENHKSSPLLPSIVPIGAPWQQIYLLARRQKKIYVEVFDLAPIKLTLSFSSTPWLLRNGVLTSGESLIHRGLMALADVEGAQIYLKQLTIAHHMASWESIQEILVRHYTRQLLHEIYKVFGSAGVIGNPLGFARSMGLGIKDFLSVPAKSVLQSPTGLITGMAQGTTSLLSNTVYAISDAATQISKAAHKGIVAFTFDDQAVAKMEKQQKGVASHSKGVINEVLEGLTGLLQSPIRGAEKHGLPGVLSGIALGVTGLVARPAASILEVTGKTAESIRNRSKVYQMGSQRFRVRLPRPLNRELPLRPYSWEEAVGTSVLVEAGDGLKLSEEVLVMCKALKQGGKFVIITERLLLIVSCSSLVALGKPEFRGIPADPEWVIEAEIGLESVIHADTDEAVVHIVGSSSEILLRQNQNQHQQKRGGGTRTKQWNNPPTTLPLFQTNLELVCNEEAEDLLQILLSTIEQGKEQGWGSGHLLHQSNLK